MDLPPPGHPIDVVFFLKYFTLIAAARLGAMTAGDTYAPADAVGLPLSEGHWGGPLAASFVGLPVLHYGLYAVGWLDEGTRSAREAWMTLSLVAFAIGGMVYYRRLVWAASSCSIKSAESRRMSRSSS